MKIKKAIFCWSGGKDSSLALYKILQQKEYEVVCLMTTLNEDFRRVSMHGVREELLESQAKAIGIPLEKMWIPKNSNNEEYENRMEALLLKYKNEGVDHVIFGDIFLEDLKAYRERNLERIGMKAVFPLWKINTKDLITEFIDSGFETVICCTNNDFFKDDTFVGQVIDKKLVDIFPSDVDVCGENGEFHTFAFNGPLFNEKINFKIGEKVLKTYEAKSEEEGNIKVETKGYWFIELLPDL